MGGLEGGNQLVVGELKGYRVPSHHTMNPKGPLALVLFCGKFGWNHCHQTTPTKSYPRYLFLDSLFPSFPPFHYVPTGLRCQVSLDCVGFMSQAE